MGGLCAISARYQRASLVEKPRILDECCQVCGSYRQSALRLLNGPFPTRPRRRRRSRPTCDSAQAVAVLLAVWEAAGYPWSVRLKALVPLWLPWIRQRFTLTPALNRQVLAISARQLDRRLAPHQHRLKRHLSGRTKPGPLLKHHIPIKTDHWDVTQPGWTKIDLVSHSGSCADSEFLHSLTLTDIHTTWTESRAVLGNGDAGIATALEQMRQDLPFTLRGLDSDNGSECLHHHLWRSRKRTASRSRAAGPTRRTTTPTSSSRTGPACASSSPGSATRLPRPWRRSMRATATTCAV